MRFKNWLTISTPSERIFGLDLLRALAIWFVLYAHNLSHLRAWVPMKVARWLVFDGVSLFFVLSGFLIGGILLRTLEKEELQFKDLKRFWMRRWLRTLPNYYLVLIVLSMYHLLFRELDAIPVWKYFLFIQNLFHSIPHYFEESWSLSIEEWFYLIVPLFSFILIRFGKMRPATALVVVALAILIFSTWWRAHTWSTLNTQNLKVWGTQIRTVLAARLDTLMYGVLAAYFAHYFPNSWKKHRSTLLIIGLIFLGFYFGYIQTQGVRSAWFATASLSFVGIGTALMLPALSLWRTSKSAWAPWITTLSLISYSAYLINLSFVKSIFIWNLQKFYPAFINDQWAALINMVLFFGGTWIGSLLLYRYFERPILKWRDQQ